MIKNKSIFTGIILIGVLVVIDSAGAQRPAGAQRSARAQKPMMQLTNAERFAMKNFSIVMNSEWSSDIQKLVDATWDDFSSSQRRAIIKHMVEQGRSGNALLELKLTNMERAALRNFSTIMSSEWGNNIQHLVDNNWNDFLLFQKRAILERMVEKRLLSENEMRNWSLNIIPKKSYGG